MGMKVRYSTVEVQILTCGKVSRLSSNRKQDADVQSGNLWWPEKTGMKVFQDFFYIWLHLVCNSRCSWGRGGGWSSGHTPPSPGGRCWWRWPCGAWSAPRWCWCWRWGSRSADKAWSPHKWAPPGKWAPATSWRWRSNTDLTPDSHCKYPGSKMWQWCLFICCDSVGIVGVIWVPHHYVLCFIRTINLSM